MALIGERPEAVYSNEEMEEIRLLASHGKEFNFLSKLDEKPDTIKGMIELKYKKLVSYDPQIFNFEKFRASEEEGEGGTLIIVIKPHPSPHPNLEFRHNKRKTAIGYLADTRFNRMQLAAQYLDNRKWDIIQLHTVSGEIPGIEIDKQIQELAIERRKSREGDQKNNDDRQVDRILQSLSPEARDIFRKKYIKEENEKRRLINEPKPKLPEIKEPPEPPEPPELKTVPGLGNKEPIVKYSDLKREAKKIIYEKPENVVLINALKEKHGKHGWSNNERYKNKIQPQIDALVLDLQKSQAKDRIQTEEEVVT